jgi:hypothetical protein
MKAERNQLRVIDAGNDPHKAAALSTSGKSFTGLTQTTKVIGPLANPLLFRQKK